MSGKAKYLSQTSNTLHSTAESRDMPRRKLPKGINALPQDVVLQSQTARLIEATAWAVSEKGYADATVGIIIARAGVSRTTFYQLYKDKEDCFLACFKQLSYAHAQTIDVALTSNAQLGQKLVDALTAWLECIDANQRYARAFIGEAEAATPKIRSAWLTARQHLGQRLREWLAQVRTAYPEVAAPTPATFDLALAGLTGFVVAEVRAGRLLAPRVPTIAAFICASLGLARWAEHLREAFPAE